MNLNQARVINPVLTNIAIGYIHPEHVGMHLFPRVPVMAAGGQVIEFGKESFQLYNARRAPGAGTKRIQFGYQGKPFALVQDALEASVPREHLRDAKEVPGIDLATRSVNVVMSSLSLSLESDQAKLATDAAKYGATHKVDLVGASKWSDAASDPVAQIDDYREVVRESVGVYPNTLVLSPKAFRALRNNDSVQGRFKYTSASAITTAMLAALLELDKVIVGKAVASSQAGVMTDVWGNNAVLAYTPQQESTIEVPSFGYTYTMDGSPTVNSPYYDNNAQSWIYGVTYERTPELTGVTSGFLIQNPY